jgi:DNA polymerase-3 subunit delta'
MKSLPWHAEHLARLWRERAALPHALLVHGQPGIGKLAFARALGAGLLCEAPAADGGACGRCPSCRWFEAGSHPDYRQIEPPAGDGEEGADAGAEKKPSLQIAIEPIRALSDFIHVSSHRAGPKVVVIHPAEALNPNAANALLKNLEEPPPRTHFVLVSHRPHRLPATVKSRCRPLPLPAPAPAAALAWLQARRVPQPELGLADSGGAPLAAAVLDAGYWQARAAFLDWLAPERDDALQAAESVRDLPVRQVLSWLQKWSYDLAASRFLGRVRYNVDLADTLAAIARRVDGLAVLRFHREMVRLQRVIDHPLNARLLIAQLLIAYRDLLRA